MSTVVLATSNGTGLGHLTRCMAIARRLPSGVRPVFLTLSQALPVAVAEGFHCEFLCSYEYGTMPADQWNAALSRRLAHVVDTYAPEVVVFDAVSAYPGLMDAVDRLPDTRFVWLRRAMWKPDMGGEQLRHGPRFHAVLEPGEYAAEADRGPTVSRRARAHRVAPTVYLSPDELADRDTAARELGLDPDRPAALVQLGSGNVRFVESAAGQVVRRLRDAGMQVAVAESVIVGSQLDLPDDVHRARVYPLSRYARAFDLAVAAPGYNLFHEAMAYALPTLLLPKPDSGRDDQAGRAAWAQSAGLAVTADAEDAASRTAGLERILDADLRADLRTAMSALPPAVGGEQAAAWLARLAAG